SDALDSAEQVTASVVTRCAVYLPDSKSSGPLHPDSSPPTVIDWIAGVSVRPGERWIVPWLSVQVSEDLCSFSDSPSEFGLLISIGALASLVPSASVFVTVTR